MSDFISDFWSQYVTWITLIGIVACILLLIVAGTKKVASTSDNTTGHVWDGDLKEMNNPLPMWWVGLFIITIVFSLAYLWLYPGLGSFSGTSNWTSQQAYEDEVAKTNKMQEPFYAAFAGLSTQDLAKDAKAMGIGERLFANNCAQCHGLDARGSKGFPNLTDKDWLYGGEPEHIKQTIVQGRFGVMPPQAEIVGSADDVKNLANYVLSLSNSPHDSVRANLGKEKFAVCAACHGLDGKGNTALGAPNLTDGIWLHGFGEQSIINMITNGKMNQMPAQESRLTPAQIDVLTAYVWSKSNADAK